MMEFLPPSAYEKVRPIFAPLGHNLAIHSILAGLSPAQVYVDSVAQPKMAITWTQARVFLAGEATDEAVIHALGHFFSNTFHPQAAAAGLVAFVLHYTPGWEARATAILPDQALVPGKRLSYQLDAATKTWPVRAPAGFSLRPVNAELLADARLKNLAYVTEEMVSERPSVADFLQKSFGYCLVHEDEIVAWCMSEYNTGHRCEVGIATAEAYRRRGLATVTATAVIAQALSQGITHIGWHCWAGNAPSIATAGKLGFQLVGEFPVYLVHVAPQPSDGPGGKNTGE
jgi:GNAT superfamily N-acetyltransferase